MSVETTTLYNYDFWKSMCGCMWVKNWAWTQCLGCMGSYDQQLDCHITHIIISESLRFTPDYFKATTWPKNWSGYNNLKKIPLLLKSLRTTSMPLGHNSPFIDLSLKCSLLKHCKGSSWVVDTVININFIYLLKWTKFCALQLPFSLSHNTKPYPVAFSELQVQ